MINIEEMACELTDEIMLMGYNYYEFAEIHHLEKERKLMKKSLIEIHNKAIEEAWDIAINTDGCTGEACRAIRLLEIGEP